MSKVGFWPTAEYGMPFAINTAPRFCAAARSMNMEVRKSDLSGGSLQISTDVIAKIASLAALEIEGIAQVSCGSAPVKGAFAKVSNHKPVEVEITDDVAQITIHMIVKYGTKVPDISEDIQKNVKACVQNMTGITVSKVNIVVEGIEMEAPAKVEEEE